MTLTLTLISRVVFLLIQVEGIPTLVVVTKEGKLLTDEGDEQV